MRKYQQLLLVFISIFSVIILLSIKSENNRLKYVLKVVNFFGRNDAFLKQVENFSYEEDLGLAQPLPVWQVIGDSFHAYATFWKKNELTSEGESLTLVAAKRSAVVKFRCSLYYEDGEKEISGKFHFQKIGETSAFEAFIFYCHSTRDHGQPKSVAYTDIANTIVIGHKLRIHHVRHKNQNATSVPKQLATICLNMFDFSIGSEFSRNDNRVQEFFIHHKILGVQHFIIYNAEDFSQDIQTQLKNFNIHIYPLPFNFPFLISKESRELLRRIIEIDCIFRNINLMQSAILLEINEFLFLNEELEDPRKILGSIENYSKDIYRFELPTFAVCLEPNSSLLMDNTFYDPEHTPLSRPYIYRVEVPISSLLNNKSHSVSLPLSLALAHSYNKCHGHNGLNNWRNRLREDFVQNILKFRNKLRVFIH